MKPHATLLPLLVLPIWLLFVDLSWAQKPGRSMDIVFLVPTEAEGFVEIMKGELGASGHRPRVLPHVGQSPPNVLDDTGADAVCVLETNPFSVRIWTIAPGGTPESSKISGEPRIVAVRAGEYLRAARMDLPRQPPIETPPQSERTTPSESRPSSPPHPPRPRWALGLGPTASASHGGFGAGTHLEGGLSLVPFPALELETTFAGPLASMRAETPNGRAVAKIGWVSLQGHARLKLWALSFLPGAGVGLCRLVLKGEAKRDGLSERTFEKYAGLAFGSLKVQTPPLHRLAFQIGVRSGIVFPRQRVRILSEEAARWGRWVHFFHARVLWSFGAGLSSSALPR